MIPLKTEIKRKGILVKSGPLKKRGYFGLYQPCFCELYQDSTILYLYIKETEDSKKYNYEFQITRKTNIDFINDSKQPYFILSNPHEIKEVLKIIDFLNLFPKKGELILSGSKADTVASWVITIRMRLFCRPSDLETQEKELTEESKKCTVDSFETLSVLGRGYFGKVTLVKKKNTGELFAMKTIKKSQISKKRKLNNVLTERNILIQVDHPFIVNFYYAFQTSTKFYLIMEYVPGGELFSHLRLFSQKDAILYLAEIGLALDYLHSIGIIYRDLKPENILFAADGHIKLTDFGLSKQISLQDLNNQTTTTFCGTFEYMAPEMITINKPEVIEPSSGYSDSSSSTLTSYSFEIDWWSFGILAYEMLFGITPFSNSNQMKLLQSIVEEDVLFPKEATPIQIDFISQFLEKDPTKRANFQSMKTHQFWEDLDFDDVLEGNICSSYIPSMEHTQISNNLQFESLTDSIGSPMNYAKLPGFSYIYDAAAQDNEITIKS